MQNLSDLQRLVRRFVAEEIDYASFRAEFVRAFLSVRHEASIEGLVNAIEGCCADLDEGDISEADLKDDLATIAKAPIILVEVLAPAGSSRVWLGSAEPQASWSVGVKPVAA